MIDAIPNDALQSFIEVSETSWRNQEKNWMELKSKPTCIATRRMNFGAKSHQHQIIIIQHFLFHIRYDEKTTPAINTHAQVECEWEEISSLTKASTDEMPVWQYFNLPVKNIIFFLSQTQLNYSTRFLGELTF